MCICRYCWECNTVTSPNKQECDVKASDEVGRLGIRLGMYLTKLHEASLRRLNITRQEIKEHQINRPKPRSRVGRHSE